MKRNEILFTDRDERRWLVKELHLIGISQTFIAEELSINIITVGKDLDFYGIERRHKKIQDYLKPILFRYIELINKDNYNISKKDRVLCSIIMKYIKYDEIVLYIEGLIKCISKLIYPDFEKEKKNYLLLLGAIFGIKSISKHDYKILLNKYLNSLNKSISSMPSNYIELKDGLASYCVKKYRSQIIFTWLWPENWKDIFDKVLNYLTPREKDVIKRRFGILDDFFEIQGYQKIADQSEVSRERIRQIEAKALRKLRHSRSKRFLYILYRKKNFIFLNDTQAVNKEYDMYKLKIFESPMYLSTKTENILRNENINFVSDLINLTERELLSKKNVGHKMMAELRHELAKFGLSFKVLKK